MKRETSGIYTDCNSHNCNDCYLCYAQGTMGEQRETLLFAVDAMRKYQLMQADYETRLKADMVAMLTEIHIEMLLDIKHEIQETEKTVDSNIAAYWWKEGIRDSVNVIQSRINILKVIQEKRSEYDKD